MDFATHYLRYTHYAPHPTDGDGIEIARPEKVEIQRQFSQKWFRRKMDSWLTHTAQQVAGMILWMRHYRGEMERGLMEGDVDSAVDNLWRIVLRKANAADIGLGLNGIVPVGPGKRSDYRTAVEFGLNLEGNACVEEMIADLIAPIVGASCVLRTGDTGIMFYLGWLLAFPIDRSDDLSLLCADGSTQTREIKSNYNGRNDGGITHFKKFDKPEGDLPSKFIVIFTDGLGYDEEVPEEFTVKVWVMERKWVHENKSRSEKFRTWDSFVLTNYMIWQHPHLYEGRFSAEQACPLVERFVKRFRERMSWDVLRQKLLDFSEPIAEFLVGPLSEGDGSPWVQELSKEHHALGYPRLYGRTSMLDDGNRARFFDLVRPILCSAEDVLDDGPIG